MPVKIKFGSKVFNKTGRRQAVSNFIRRQAKDFTQLTKRRIIESKPSGRQYSRKRGNGFTRSYRASARGQRPAIDSGKLLNSIKDRRISETSAESFAGAYYAEYLQSERLHRPIMSDQDATEAQQKANRDAITFLTTLT